MVILFLYIVTVRNGDRPLFFCISVQSSQTYAAAAPLASFCCFRTVLLVIPMYVAIQTDCLFFLYRGREKKKQAVFLSRHRHLRQIFCVVTVKFILVI